MADEQAVFVNLNQVRQYVTGMGYTCAYKKLKKAADEGRLVNRRGGGWTRAAVDKFVRAYLVRDVDLAPEQDAPLAPDPEAAGAAERKTESQAELLAVQAARAKKAFAEEMGRLTPTAVIEAELSERAKAFRLGLERFGHAEAEGVAGLFGGHRRQAQELVRRIGLEGEQAEQAVAIVVDFCLSRASAFPRYFAGRVDAFLDAYATGRWWTEDMEAAWDTYQANREVAVPEVHDV